MGSKITCLNLTPFGRKIWHKIPPRRLQDAHMTRQDAPRRPQDAHNTPPRRPKMTPRPPKCHPRRLPDALVRWGTPVLAPLADAVPIFAAMDRWGTPFLVDFWTHFGANFELSWAIFGRFLDPCWCQLRAILGHFGVLNNK